MCVLFWWKRRICCTLFNQFWCPPKSTNLSTTPECFCLSFARCSYFALSSNHMITKRWSIGIKGGYRRLPGARNPRGTRTGSTLGHLVSWLSSVRDADSKSTLSYVGLKWIKVFESFQTKQGNLRQSRFRTYRIAGWLTMQRFVGQNASQEAREATDNRGSDAAPVLWLRSVVNALHCSWF